MTRPRYLVTGGCGFIGSHLVDRLQAGGAAVRVLDDLSTGRRENLSGPVDLRIGDVADPATLRAALAGVDGVFHLAAVASVDRCNQAWLPSHRCNQSAAVALFDFARPAALDLPVVYASSAAVYGRCRDLPLSETTPPAPVSAYGADKLGCELHARAGAEVHGLHSIGLRFFNVYGPRQDPRSPYSGVISIFADRIARGQPVTIFGDGQQSRDFIDVADVAACLDGAMARLHAHAAARWEGGREDGVAEIFNVCTGRATTVRDLAHLIGGIVGRRPALTQAPPREGDIRHSVGTPARAQTAFGCRAPRSLKDGLARLLKANLVPQ